MRGHLSSPTHGAGLASGREDNLISPCPRVTDGEDGATPVSPSRPVRGRRLPGRLRARRAEGPRSDLRRVVGAPVPVSPPPQAVPSAGAATEGRRDEAAPDGFYSAGGGVCDVTAVRGEGGGCGRGSRGLGRWRGDLSWRGPGCLQAPTGRVPRLPAERRARCVREIRPRRGAMPPRGNERLWVCFVRGNLKNK